MEIITTIPIEFSPIFCISTIICLKYGLFFSGLEKTLTSKRKYLPICKSAFKLKIVKLLN